MSNLIPFSFEGKSVRVIKQGDAPHWVLTDVCKVLEIGNSRKAASRLDDDEKGVTISDTLGGPQEMTTINESGLWSLVLTSRKPEAKRFKKWLTSEVIPTIRKTGGYMVATPEETPEQIMARALQLANDTLARQRAELEAAAPKAAAFDELANTNGLFTLRESAKLCGWPEKLFIRQLVMPPIKWLYVHSSSGRKLAYAAPIKAGYMDVKEVTVFHNTTGRETYGQPMITQKGLTKLAQTLGKFAPEKGGVA